MTFYRVDAVLAVGIARFCLSYHKVVLCGNG